MALNAYLKITGQKQGAINGSVTQKGHENSILIHAFSNEIDSPRDPASGLPTGKRMHKPCFLLKEVDKSSPLLWNALTNNENLTSCQIQFWTPANAAAGTGVGVEKQVYTVTLTNASIASMVQSMPSNVDPSTAKLSLQEEITLTYQKIQWTWNDGGVTAGDDWEAAVA
jgi:type VI secretion system secreted protein Hcp